MSTSASTNQKDQIGQLLDFMSEKGQVETVLNYSSHFPRRRAQIIQKWDSQQIRAFLAEQMSPQEDGGLPMVAEENSLSKYWVRSEKAVFEWLALAYMYMHGVDSWHTVLKPLFRVQKRLGFCKESFLTSHSSWSATPFAVS